MTCRTAAKPKEEKEGQYPMFNNYFAKMLAAYAGITEAEYDGISKRRREAKIGKAASDY